MSIVHCLRSLLVGVGLMALGVACSERPSYPELGCTPTCCSDRPARRCSSFWYSEAFAHIQTQIRDDLVRALPLGPGSVVVDVGAGEGSAEPSLSQRVGPTGKVIATEINASVYAKLQAHVRKHQLRNVETVLLSNLYHTGLENREPGTVDAVLFVNSMTFFNTPGARERDVSYFRQFFKALKPGGVLVYHKGYTHNHQLKERTMRARLREAGFISYDQRVPLPEGVKPTTCFCNAAVPTKMSLGYTLMMRKPME